MKLLDVTFADNRKPAEFEKAFRELLARKDARSISISITVFKRGRNGNANLSNMTTIIGLLDGCSNKSVKLYDVAHTVDGISKLNISYRKMHKDSVVIAIPGEKQRSLFPISF